MMGILNYTDPNLVYFVGNGKLPANTAEGDIYKSADLGLLVDVRTSLILDAYVTLISPLALEFVKAQLVGKNLEQDLDKIIADLDRYQGSAQKAIIVALRAAYDRFQRYKRNLLQVVS